MARLVVAGNDKIGRGVAARIAALADVVVVLDASTDLRRIVRLIMRRRMPLRALALMAAAEWRRRDTQVPQMPAVHNNSELLARALAERATAIYLFRAGLIVKGAVLESGVPVFNVHCAALPAYGGIASIWRALRDGQFDQAASMHRVTSAIDGGEVLEVERYRLDPARPYWANEDLAYAAGERLLVRALRDRA